jgi:DNA (cytosine-5)-methyltransferase 1
MLKVLDLFSGIGGFSLGLERTGGFETVAFCENEKSGYPQKVLAKHWPEVPIYEDVRNVTAKQLRSDGIIPNVITGGFPCQDISVAGNQKGMGEGTRSGLWSECARLVGEIRPRYAIFENVTALLSGDNGRWFQRVLFDLSEVGYDAEWHCIPASELGAHHHRDRVWIIAYPRLSESQGRDATQADNDRCGEAGIQQGSESPSPCGDVAYPDNTRHSASQDGIDRNREEEVKKRERLAQPKPCRSSIQQDVPNPNDKRSVQRLITRVSGEKGSQPNDQPIKGRGKIYRRKEDVSNTIGKRQQGQGKYEQSIFAEAFENRQTANALSGGSPDIWKVEPELGRVADGIRDRSHRLKGLGNAVVPQIPELIGRAILEAENEVM